MNSALNLLLRMGITSSLQDREAVIDRISAVLESKMGTDPDKSQKVGEQILNGLEGLKDQLSIEQIVSSITRNDDAVEKRLNELTEAINRLNENVEKLMKK
jgi:methyl-accepting chemotaxis protein